ncbi:mechanosensitive ion channel family protein [Marilutibacter alkalisoli]|uniref:Small-conductance mechanosensitive channel n=1 Tax=Marilutibacter alkalisoli TaxID=2591633 RepID=A0A514BRW8_9GAMM|nr:mechanosensitive ion channel domain-containing protein [Lysobacter alkalisoli]QDH70065.1 mechanosensitive ion channel [Lysobacter alkalisoli]
MANDASSETLTQTWLAQGIDIGIELLIAVVVFVVGLRIARWLTSASVRAMTRASMDPIGIQFMRKVVYIGLLIVLLLALLQGVFGVAPTSMIAVLGAAGLAIGLALKDSLSNVASGVMLVSLKPFRVGDVVTIANQTGKVEEVSIFQTRLRGADNQIIVLPNSLITADPIVNLTPDVMRRIELVIGIGYGDDIDVARSIALEAMHSDERVLADPPPDVLVYALAENSINLGIRCHVANIDFFVTKCELTERIKKGFDAAGITIPFPQRDVHMYHHTPKPGAEQKALSQAQASSVSLDSPDHQPSVDPE